METLEADKAQSGIDFVSDPSVYWGERGQFQNCMLFSRALGTDDEVTTFQNQLVFTFSLFVGYDADYDKSSLFCIHMRLTWFSRRDYPHISASTARS